MKDTDINVSDIIDTHTHTLMENYPCFNLKICAQVYSELFQGIMAAF